MTQVLTAQFEKQFPNGPLIAAALQQSVAEYSLTVLFGPSGSGKTTILRCLAGLERPERGSIRFGDAIWFDAERTICLPPQQRNIGYCAQDYALFPHLDVAANIAYGLGEMAAKDRRRRVGELVELVGLTGLDHRYPRQLSGGQQQRVALARTLARRPALLLLDEPLAALDTPTRDQLRPELRRWLAETRIPVLLVTHERAEAEALADTVVIVHAGRILQRGPAATVFARPASASVARIVGFENLVNVSITRETTGQATVRLGAAQWQVAADAIPSGSVLAAIRAENVRIEAPATLRRPGELAVPGMVQSATPEGPLVRVHLACGCLLIGLMSHRDYRERRWETGHAVEARVDIQDVHFSPAE